MERGETITIWDAYFHHQFTGPILKMYDKGLTIETKNGIVCYATFDKIVKPEEVR